MILRKTNICIFLVFFAGVFAAVFGQANAPEKAPAGLGAKEMLAAAAQWTPAKTPSEYHLFVVRKYPNDAAYKIVFQIEIPQETAFHKSGNNNGDTWTFSGLVTSPDYEKILKLDFTYHSADKNVGGQSSVRSEIYLHENTLTVHPLPLPCEATQVRQFIMVRRSAPGTPAPTQAEIAAAIEKADAIIPPKERKRMQESLRRAALKNVQTTISSQTKNASDTTP